MSREPARLEKITIINPDCVATRQFVYEIVEAAVRSLGLGQPQKLDHFRALVVRLQEEEIRDGAHAL